MTDGTDRFFAFARERHSIYLRRRELANREFDVPEVLTLDPILSKYRFTNVFRELDKTTKWWRAVSDQMCDNPEVLLATVVFRWFNRIATGERIFLHATGVSGLSAFDLRNHADFIPLMRDMILADDNNGPYVTGAYIIKTPDGYNKLDGVLKCIEWFMDQEHPFTTPQGDRTTTSQAKMSTWLSTEDESSSLEEVWKWLRQFPYLGDFMAYEIVTDLRHTGLLDQAPDIMTWANPGPGATRGLGRIFDPEGAELDEETQERQKRGKYKYNQHRDKDHLIDLMRDLLIASQDSRYWPREHRNGLYVMGEYSAGDLSFMAGYTSVTNDWPRWEMREVEHTLCEFDKYERVRTGEGRPRGTFR